MTRERLRAALAAQPFVPFLLHVPDGRSIRVGHPEVVIAPPEERVICVWDGRDYRFVDLFLVSDIEFVRDRRRRSA